MTHAMSSQLGYQHRNRQWKLHLLYKEYKTKEEAMTHPPKGDMIPVLDKPAVLIEKLCEILSETIAKTKRNTDRKQALNYDEMEAEREEEDEPEVESDDEDQQIYNPLKLPMGWDGKPIPYWLYKLHGLGQEFRYQYGMGRLGIPNTKNFNEGEVAFVKVSEARNLDREVVESGLTFAGFAVFNCPIRGDSAAVLLELKQSSHDLVSGANLVY
ncbi:splicing factor [Artemisia annua]|uniref:Splicing factor n=1 Tax=Artemisia annua TaxID=35608 RepID=A0A2U1LEN3_ARTAN|nr:splicing factor [Artemisia annua]